MEKKEKCECNPTLPRLVVNKLIWKCILLLLWPYSNHKVHIPILLLAFEISTAAFELFRNLNSIWEQIIRIRCNKYCFIQLIRRIICQGCALLLWNYQQNAFPVFNFLNLPARCSRPEMFWWLYIQTIQFLYKSDNFIGSFEWWSEFWCCHVSLNGKSWIF